MRDKYILTAESVTEGHPDKLCDTIADSVLDACLKGDSSAHVACEVLATAGKVLVAGEISATGQCLWACVHGRDVGGDPSCQ